MTERDSILVVDDEPLSLIAKVKILQKNDYLIYQADTGLKGLEIARTHRPDLVLLDIVLPDINGLEVCRQLKANPETERIFIVLTSCVLTSSDEQAAGLEAGADDYIACPIANREMLARVKANLRIVHTEKRLRVSEEKYRELVENLNDVLYTVNSDGIITYVSSAIHAVLGYTAAELTGDHFTRMVHPQDMNSIKTAFDDVISGKLHPSEYRMKKKDGTYCWVRTSSRPFFENNIVRGLQGILTNIDDRKKAEIALKFSETELKFAQKIAKIGSWYWDIKTDLVDWSDQTYDIFGAPHVTPSFDFEKSFVHPDDAELWHNTVNVARKEGKAFNLDYRAIRSDGQIIWIHNESKTVFDKDGDFVGIRGIVQDITEKRQLEQEREKLQQQLFQSQKMESIGRLAGGLAHDFNNLLTAISGFAELIFEQLDENDPLKRDIEAILRSAQSGSQLTNQLLVFSQKQIFSPKTIEINQEILRSEMILKRLLGEDIELIFHPGDNLKYVRFDATQLEQILVNLSVNAREAMPKGGLLTLETINVTLPQNPEYTNNRPPPGEYVLITIQDSGIGMEPEIMKNIFEPFFTTKPEGKGTGLGLSTVYGILKQHNSHIYCESQINKGAIFSIYVPVCDEIPQTESEEYRKGDYSGTETILLVEDEELVRSFTKRVLESLRYTVIEANDGTVALEKMKQYNGLVDLLVTDVVMPRMSGKELYDHISVLFPDLDVLYISGYTQDIIAQHEVLGKGINFLSKPFHPKDLARKVRHILDSRKRDTAPKELDDPKNMVLIIDDDADIRELASLHIAAMKYDTVTAESGEEGLTVFDENRDRIVLVLLDLTLPDQSGISVLHTLQEKQKTLPVILVSGYSPDEVVEELNASKWTFFLAKPFMKKDIQHAVQEALLRGAI